MTQLANPVESGYPLEQIPSPTVLAKLVFATKHINHYVADFSGFWSIPFVKVNISILFICISLLVRYGCVN